ncbi:MAG: type VII secretion integral membrane protein EccD [Micromonosporaceae bacterium]
MVAPVSVPPKRVTVVTPRTRIDLSLPVHSTVAELVPQLLRMSAADSEPQPPGVGWELRRLGGPALDSEHTIAAAGVRDGEVLYLSPHDRRAVPLLFDDVVDAIASAAEERPGVWRPLVSRRACLATATVAFIGVAVLLAFAGLRWPAASLVTGGYAVVLLMVGAALARAYGDATAGAVIAAAGLPAALLAGMEAYGPSSGVVAAEPVRLALGCAALVVYTVVAAVGVADQIGWYAGTCLAAATGCLAAGATVVGGVSGVSVAAVVATVVVLATPGLPMVALRLGRMPLPRVPSDVKAFRRDEDVTLGPQVQDDTQRAGSILTGLVTAIAVVVGTTAVVLLLGTDDRWAWTLVAVAGIAVLLRCRAYVGVGQRIALLLAGGVAFAGVSVRLLGVSGTTGRLLLVAAVALVGVVAIGYALRAAAQVASPYWSRVLDIVEFVALISLVPVTAAVLDLYAAVRAWGG